MGTTDKYCLRWNDYRSNISVAFQELRSSADFFDVTLATEDTEVRAHRVILSACSPHLRDLLKRHSNSSNPNLVIYLRGVQRSDLEAILEFMYNGEVNVSQDDLSSFLAVAEDLKVKGLTQNLGGSGHATSTQEAGSSAHSNLPTPGIRTGNKATLTPSNVAKKNGGSSLTLTPSQATPAKRLKPEPTALINVKEEAGMAKSSKMVITPEVNYDGEEGANTTNDQDDEAAYGEEGNDNSEMYYEDEEYGSEGDILVDPSSMIAAGTSASVSGEGTNAEQDYLTSEIGEYLTSMSARREDGQYQCLVCARISRDLYNQRQHIMTHMMKDGEFLDRLDHFVKSHSIQQNTNSFSCLLCRMIITRGYYMVRQHFFSKHLKEEKYSETY